MVTRTGVEPVLLPWKDSVLTAWPTSLNGGKKWIRTTEPEGADLQSAAFDQLRYLPNKKWRIEWDSNPRTLLHAYRFSRPNSSATWVSILELREDVLD